jgi:flagellar protein FlaJ
MATESETDSTGESIDITNAFGDIADSYRQMQIPISRYVTWIVFPGVGFFVLTVVAGIVLDLPLVVRLPMPALGLLLAVTALIYPKIRLDQRRKRMNEVFHLYVTHMTVLSTTNIDRVEVFRRIARMDDYGPLSEETRRIVQLVDTWNQSLDDACRRRAKKVPSDAVSDFFDRLSYTINAGEDLSSYLVSEQ